jgi:hypothetical protein
MGGAILVKTLEDEGIGIERGIKKLSLKLFINFVSCVGIKL